MLVAYGHEMTRGGREGSALVDGREVRIEEPKHLLQHRAKTNLPQQRTNRVEEGDRAEDVEDAPDHADVARHAARLGRAAGVLAAARSRSAAGRGGRATAGLAGRRKRFEQDLDEPLHAVAAAQERARHIGDLGAERVAALVGGRVALRELR